MTWLIVLFFVVLVGAIAMVGVELWKSWSRRRRRESLIITYVNLVNCYGLGSKQALDFRYVYKKNDVFLRRADAFDRMKDMAQRGTKL